MKIQIKSIAIALAIGGASLASVLPAMAQNAAGQHHMTNERLSPHEQHERNTQLAGKFLKTEDEKVAYKLIEPIKNGMMEELAVSKRQILKANESGDEKAAENATQFNQKLGDIYNTIIQASRSLDSFDKNVVDKALTEYLTLKP